MRPSASDSRDVTMAEAEDAVREVNVQRQQGLLAALPTSRQAQVDQFPELSSKEDGAAAMDYELSVVPSDMAAGALGSLDGLSMDVLLAGLAQAGPRTANKLAAIAFIDRVWPTKNQWRSLCVSCRLQMAPT